MYLKVQANFSVQEHGWVHGCDTIEMFDASKPLHEQAEQAAADWVERRNRIFGSALREPVVLSAFFCHQGFWHAETRKSAADVLRWPSTVAG